MKKLSERCWRPPERKAASLEEKSLFKRVSLTLLLGEEIKESCFGFFCNFET